MRKIFLIVMFLATSIIPLFAELREANTFRVTYKMVFNAITLEEAARIEEQIKDNFKDACNVIIEAKHLEKNINMWIEEVSSDLSEGGTLTMPDAETEMMERIVNNSFIME